MKQRACDIIFVLYPIIKYNVCAKWEHMLARAQRALVQPRNNHYLLVKQSLVKNVFVFGPVYM